MAKGGSGRIVIEVEPELKRQLYSALALDSQTLKDWFVEAAGQYLAIKKESVISEQEAVKRAGKKL